MSKKAPSIHERMVQFKESSSNATATPQAAFIANVDEKPASIIEERPAPAPLAPVDTDEPAKKLLTSVPADLYWRFKTIAARKRQTLEQANRAAVAEYVERYEKG